VNENDFTNRQANIDQLRKEYDTTLAEYTTLMNKLTGATNGFFDRVNPNNPYLNKTVVFTTGHVCYVTNQGVVKYISNMEIWRSSNIPQEVQVNLNIPWHDSYSTPGTPIPTNPPLISGTFVQLGQSFGNEGENVFVNQLVSNPQDKYIGCYNDKPQATEIKFVPKMNSSNTVSGYTSRASSIYLNDNNIWGPWAAFDKTKDIVFGIFYTGDSQSRDYISPNRTIYNPNGRIGIDDACAFSYIPLKTQVVPFYLWDIKNNQSVSNIFGNQENNWSADIFSYNYQGIDRLYAASRNFQPDPNINQINYHKGWIYNVNDYSNLPDPINDATGEFDYKPKDGIPGSYLLGAPFYFYFGLTKGASAFDRFTAKWIDTDGFV
jgi:hypothetical protein